MVRRSPAREPSRITLASSEPGFNQKSPKTDVLYSSSAGRIGFAADARPWAVDTFTYVASMTKLITCTAVMQLVERGAVGLDDDVRKIVPRLADMQILRGFDGDEQPILEDNTTPVTLRYVSRRPLPTRPLLHQQRPPD